jgi:hypothetical protein
MQMTIEIPDKLARQLEPERENLAEFSSEVCASAGRTPPACVAN